MGEYYVSAGYLNPDRYELTPGNGRKVKGRISGCGGLRKWVGGNVNCKRGGWRRFTLKTFKDDDFMLKIFKGGTLLACFKND